jgi:hypothetical protein
MEERGHILEVLRNTSSALKDNNYIVIKNLSNQVIHNSSITQDPDVISVAVIIYVLSKILERDKYKEYDGWIKFYKSYISHLDNSINYLEKEDVNKFRIEIASIREIIQKLSGNLKNYIEDVFRKAQINKASRIYEHGISMEKTAKILGISLWELAEYAGNTRIGDVNLSVTLPIKQRIKQAEEIFK